MLCLILNAQVRKSGEDINAQDNDELEKSLKIRNEFQLDDLGKDLELLKQNISIEILQNEGMKAVKDEKEDENACQSVCKPQSYSSQNADLKL